MLLSRLTWPEVADAVARGDAWGLVPTGSFEQHGPHLPLITDAAFADVLAGMIAQRIAQPCLTMPALPIGISGHHTGFPGTATVSEELFAAAVGAQVDALERAGVERVALFSAHGGNFAALGRIAAARSAPRLAAYADVHRFVGAMADAGRAAGLDPGPADWHAGVLETSMALSAFPDVVRAFEGVRGYGGEDPDWQARMAAKGVDALSASGVLGDPAGANAEAGAAILAALADELAHHFAAALDLDLQPTPTMDTRSERGN